MIAEFSVFVICVEAIMYLLLYNLHDSTFKVMFSDIRNCAIVIKLIDQRFIILGESEFYHL